MSTRDSTSTHLAETFRLVVGKQANAANTTVASDIDEATTAPDLSPTMFVAGDLRALTRTLVGHIGTPISGSSIAAFLESQGWADTDAQDMYDCANLMDLGQRIWQEGWSIHGFESVEGWSAAKSAPASNEHLHLRGPYFLAIALIQIVGVVLVSISLGGGVGLTSPEATTMGTGLLLGLVWAGGFGQLLARDPWSLHLQGDDALAGLAALRVIGLSIGLAVLACGVVIGLVVATRESAVAAMGLGIACFLGIMLFWLLVNALLAMGLGLASVIATGLALAVVTSLVMAGPFDLPPQTAPAVALVMACVFMGVHLVAWWTAKRRRARPNQHLPRLAGMTIDQFGYIVYGAGLMLLIVLDRVVGWHAGAQTGWLSFQASYEIGLGWALLAFLVAVVGQELVLAKFVRWIKHRMVGHQLGDIQGYQRVVCNAYWSRLVCAFIIAAASGLVVTSVLAWASSVVTGLRPILPVAEGLVVFCWGVVGYSLLSVAVFNTGLLVAVSQPGRLILPLLFSLFVDLAVALVATQALGYPASVLGLIAGAATLLGCSTVQVTALLKTPIYSLY